MPKPYKNECSIYDYKKLQGYKKFKYIKYNATHGTNHKNFGNYRKVTGNKSNREIKIHHIKRNKMRDIISHNTFDTIESVLCIIKCSDKFGDIRIRRSL